MKAAFHRFLTIHPTLQPLLYSFLGAVPSRRGKSSPSSIGFPGSNVLIVAGAGRSGNTLLRRLLIERAEIYIPPETYVLGGIVSTLLKNNRLCWDSQVNLALGSLEYHPEFTTFGVDSLRDFALSAKQWPLARRQVGTLVYELYGWFAARLQIRASWIGDKTPLNTMHLGLIDGLFPFGRYVYMERDPFDVVASYVKIGACGNYHEAAERWILSRKAWSSFRWSAQSDRAVKVRYEDLIRFPDQTISSILDRFGIPERTCPLDATLVLGDVGSRQHHDQVLGRITTNAVGVGRANLPPEVRSTLGRKLNKAAVAAGYSPL